GGWWLRSVLGSGSEGEEAVGAAFGGVALGRKAAHARASEKFTEFDGYVPEAGRALDPCADGTTLSVTELERAADCPFRFFLKRGLGIRPVDERERDKDVWLDPLTRGTELHDLYALFLRRCREAGRRPHGSHRQGRRRLVRGGRLQDGRILARRLEWHVQRRPSSSACALRPGRGRAASEQVQEAKGDCGRVLLFQP